MIAIIIKKILSYATITVNFSEGDQLHIKIMLGNRVILDKTIDILPGA